MWEKKGTKRERGGEFSVVELSVIFEVIHCFCFGVVSGETISWVMEIDSVTLC